MTDMTNKWVKLGERVPDTCRTILLKLQDENTGMLCITDGFYRVDASVFVAYQKINKLKDGLQLLAWAELPED